MDIDSRINWAPGMELTARTFKQLDLNLDFRQQMAVRAALGSARLGLLPDTVFSCKGIFVKNTYEIERFQCVAVLPSGRILSADEKVSLTIPMLFGREYYLTVAPGAEERTFEKEGVPFVARRKEYAIRTWDELAAADQLPVARFQVEDGAFSIDPDYIPPCLMLSSDERFAQYGATFVEKLQQLAAHRSLPEGEGKRALLRYLFQLKGWRWDGSLTDFVRMTQELAQAIDYYIVTPNTEAPVEIPSPSQYDIQKWLKWLSEYLAAAGSILDNVILEDTAIDYEALLAQAKAELYERLNPELYERLLQQIKEDLREELRRQLSGSLMTFINDELKPALHDKLSEELDPALYDRLYQALYESLYNALYVPTEAEEDFYPLM